MKKFVGALAVLALVAACGKTYTVEDFMQNETLRKEMLAKCNNGELRPEDMNCINSGKAEMKIKVEKGIRKLNAWN